jgi:hypothetical protein
MATNNGSMEAFKANLVNLCDIGTILGLHMLEYVNVLMKFTHAKDVVICDYIATIKICQVDLYKMYNGSTTSF